MSADAETTFRLWRRMLREDDLQRAIFESDVRDQAAHFGLTPEEVEIALAFKEEGHAVSWPLRQYRWELRAMVEETLTAYCPLTISLLAARGQDVQEWIHRYLASTGWFDVSPFAHRICVEFLEHLRDNLAVAEIPYLADAITLELASHQLIRRLARLPASQWLAPYTPPVVKPEVRYQRTPGAVVVTMEHELTPLIMAPEDAASLTLEARPQHILVYLSALDESVGYAVITAGARCVFEAMEQPLTLSECAALLAGKASDERDRARSILTRFLNLCVIRAPDGMNDDAPDDMIDDVTEGEEITRSSILAMDHWNQVAAARGNARTECLDAILDSVIQGCGDAQGKRVLDAGTGNGETLVALARQGAHAVGVDIAGRSLEEARTHAHKELGALATRISLHRMDVARLAFADASFDAITCVKTIWVFQPLVDVLREFHRVLRPGGRLVIQLWGDPEKNSLMSSGTSVLQRFDPDLRNAPIAPVATMASDFTPVGLERQMTEIGFAPARERSASYERTLDIGSAALFWECFRSVAGTGYWMYAGNTPVVRAAMDEQWSMETSRLREPGGAVPLTLAWHIVTATKIA